MRQILAEAEKQKLDWAERERHYAVWRTYANGTRSNMVFVPKTPGSDHSIRNSVGKLRRGLGFKWRGH